MTMALAARQALAISGMATDAALVARCRTGDRVAFGILLHRYRARIVSLALQIVWQREDAEDIAQEAFTRAFTSLHSYRGEAQFATWLYRITVNLCLQHRRRHKDCAPLHNDLLEEYATATPGVEQQVAEKLTVLQTLQGLSEPLRIVLILHEMHELSYCEIAHILSIPEGTVASRLSEARRKFKLRWRELESEGDA